MQIKLVIRKHGNTVVVLSTAVIGVGAVNLRDIFARKYTYEKLTMPEFYTSARIIFSRNLELLRL